jgi:phosphoribosylamine--glycine ligase
MKLLILGADGRAHTLVWKLFNSPLAQEVVCAPGNGGAGQLVPCADLPLADAAAIARWGFDEGFDIIIPAGSTPVQAGLVDEVISLQISVCGPSQRSAALERSRCRAKAFMLRHGLPTPVGRPFTDLPTAERYLATLPLPVIIKADHPAGGEAVFHDRYAALAGLRELFALRPVDVESEGVVIEQFIAGPRVVLSAFTDGRTAVPLLATRLYDRVTADDAGPAARGIGAHTGESEYARRLTEYLLAKFIRPLMAALAADGLPYWGILSADCVIGRDGPRLIAIRSSMREGEAQVVLPRLEDDLLPWVQAMIAQRLHDMPPPRWSPRPTVGIGLYTRGYPSYAPSGGTIHGLDTLDPGVLAFHSATENPAGFQYTPRAAAGRRGLPLSGGLFSGGPAAAGIRATGGLAVTVVASGATLAEARERALANAGRISFDGRMFREDIGAKEFG